MRLVTVHRPSHQYCPPSYCRCLRFSFSSSSSNSSSSSSSCSSKNKNRIRISSTVVDAEQIVTSFYLLRDRNVSMYCDCLVAPADACKQDYCCRQSWSFQNGSVVFFCVTSLNFDPNCPNCRWLGPNMWRNVLLCLCLPPSHCRWIMVRMSCLHCLLLSWLRLNL